MNNVLTSANEELRIIEKARDGHQPSYKLLYDLHIEALFRFLLQFTDSREQSREWVQRAFIKAFDRLNQFKGHSSFKTWLFTIGLNEMRTDLRKTIHFQELDEGRLEEYLIEESDVTDEAIWTEAKEALRELAPDKRMICLLHVAEGYSHEEIGTMLGISEVASRVALHRAKQELRQKVNHNE